MVHSLVNNIFNPESMEFSRSVRGLVRPTANVSVGDEVNLYTQQKTPYRITEIIERRPSKGNWIDERQDFIHFRFFKEQPTEL